jgi:hypothetical protein
VGQFPKGFGISGKIPQDKSQFLRNEPFVKKKSLPHKTSRLIDFDFICTKKLHNSQ